MSAYFFAFAVVIKLIVPEATSGGTRGHFPLENCLDEVDMLSLFNDVRHTLQYQSAVFSGFEESISNLISGMNGSRLLVAQVIDHFSSHNVSIDVGNWSFDTFQSGKEPYQNRSIANVQARHSEIQTVLEEKIQFVQRLFNEMRGVRQTAIHVGVIFLQGSMFSEKQIFYVPTILQKQGSFDVRIFAVVLGNYFIRSKSVMIPSYDISYYAEIVMMAICKRCFHDRIMFENTVGTHFISCYRIEKYKHESTYKPCESEYQEKLATIQSVEEMTFLQDYIRKIIKYNSSLYTDIGGNFQIKKKPKTTTTTTKHIHIYLGLRRDLGNYAKRFRWFKDGELALPMVITHWFPDKPSGGNYKGKDCVRWTFRNIRSSDRKNNATTRNISNDENSFDEGWEDIYCEAEIAGLTLCEVSLPQYVEHVYNISRESASKESLEKAFKKGDFLSFKGNIVSVSENVANTDFLQFLKTNNKDFPMFDCEDGGDERRYIPYAFVCDGIDHCSKKRDEFSCDWPQKLQIVEECKEQCTSGQVVPHKGMWCDNVKDCTDGSDESLRCINYPCKSIRCCDGSCLPLQWVNDGEFDCPVCKDDSSVFDDESAIDIFYLNHGTNCALICNTMECVNVSQLNDGHTDCKGPEGPLDERIGALEPANTCNNSVGYIWAPKCVYVLDRYGGTIGCRDMSHLRDCKNFRCGEGYVKCQNSYCIPLHYVLDGKADCPTGEDEQFLYIGLCIGNFACWNSEVCLHPDLVCDGLADCPHKDDELSCQVCPKGLRCTGGTVTVSGYITSYPTRMSNCPLNKRTKYLDLSLVDYHKLDYFIVVCLTELLNMQVLIMSNCNITEGLVFQHIFGAHPTTLRKIRKLDISYNLIREIFDDYVFNQYFENLNYLNVSFNADLASIKNLQFKFLEIIDLSHTRLSYLDESVFVGLPALKHLNLSHTLITDFNGRYFPAAFTLQTLDLRGTRIADVNAVLFHDLTVIQNLPVDLVQMCCPQIRGPTIASHVCQDPVDAISSCFDLVKLPVQRVLLWVMAVLAVLGNMAVIIYRVIWDRSVLKTGYGLFVTNLAISDFIMGVYIFIVAGADYIFIGIYVLNENKWKQSVACNLAGFLATLSSETSTFFISLITLDRYVVIKFPFGEKKLSQIVKISSVALSWFTCVSLSLIPLVFNLEIYSTNAMCLGLPLTSAHVKGWEYSVGVFIIFNFFMFLCIAYGQCAIFCAMSENRISRTASSMSRSRRAEDITVAKHLSLVVLSDFLVWFPVGLMGLMSLGGHNVSDEVYAWTTVLLLPINSAVNPVLYTIPAIMNMWEKFKYGDQRTLFPSV